MYRVVITQKARRAGVVRTGAAARPKVVLDRRNVGELRSVAASLYNYFGTRHGFEAIELQRELDLAGSFTYDNSVYLAVVLPE